MQVSLGFIYYRKSTFIEKVYLRAGVVCSKNGNVGKQPSVNNLLFIIEDPFFHLSLNKSSFVDFRKTHTTHAWRSVFPNILLPMPHQNINKTTMLPFHTQTRQLYKLFKFPAVKACLKLWNI